MTQVIYIDILIIVNIYIGYALLRLTGLICSLRVNRLRLLASSLLQGAYSLVILLPELHIIVKLPIRAAVSAAFVLTAFGVASLRQFLRLYAAFLSVSSAFAGLMFLMWFFLSPRGMAYGNSTVYFGINTLSLAVMTVVCYVIIRVAHFFIRQKTGSDSLCRLRVSAFGKRVSCEALIDTGNGLCDVFSGLPVIVLERSLAEKLLCESEPIDMDKLARCEELPRGFRVTPCSTVGGESLMATFKPDLVEIKTATKQVETKSVYIGIASEKIRGGFGAILGTGAFENAVAIRKERNTHEFDKSQV